MSIFLSTILSHTLPAIPTHFVQLQNLSKVLYHKTSTLRCSQVIQNNQYIYEILYAHAFFYKDALSIKFTWSFPHNNKKTHYPPLGITHIHRFNYSSTKPYVHSFVHPGVMMVTCCFGDRFLPPKAARELQLVNFVFSCCFVVFVFVFFYFAWFRLVSFKQSSSCARKNSAPAPSSSSVVHH